MKAIIAKSQTSHGQDIQLLGAGNNEHQARLIAYKHLHQGFNEYDLEFHGGELIDISPEFEEVITHGSQVEFNNALFTLFVNESNQLSFIKRSYYHNPLL